jgi:uncharacterized membrane protein YhaH (DUF805 family)
MKHSQTPIQTRDDDRPLRFLDFIRVAAFLTLCIFPFVFLLAASLTAKRHDRTLWELTTFLTLFPIWVGTLTVGCLVMIPVWIWRLCKRLARKGAGKPIPYGRLWDRWMDGPEPLQS